MIHARDADADIQAILEEEQAAVVKRGLQAGQLAVNRHTALVGFVLDQLEEKREEYWPDLTVEEIHAALTLGLHDYARKNGFQKVVVGLSGGVDSSVLLAAALDQHPLKVTGARVVAERVSPSADLLAAMDADCRIPLRELRVDGGASVNDLLMQFQADLLGIPVVRPKVIETTALGAAYLAGLSAGVYRSLDELAAQWQVERRFLPTLPREQAAERMAAWERAVRQATAA